MDIWLKDLDGGAPQRLTSHGDYIGTIIWSPDDRRFYYARSVGMAGYEARVHDLDSGADSVVARTGGVFVIPNSVTPDGKWLLLSASDSTGRSDMWVMPTDGSAPAHPWKRTPQEEQGGIFSPDGRWIATAAVGPNGIEISLDAFPGPGPHYQVTAGGSNYIQWTHSGDGILLVDNSGLVSLLPVQWTPVVRFGTPRRLFSMAPDISMVGFAGTSRGYLVARRDESGRDVSLEGVLNWTRLLERH